MRWVGVEHMIPMFNQTKTVHALDRAATVIGHDIRMPVEKSDVYAQAFCFVKLPTKYVGS
jgi:hypothetical protein